LEHPPRRADAKQSRPGGERQSAGRMNLLRSTPGQTILLMMFAISLIMSICFESYNEFDLLVFAAASLLVFSVSFSRRLAKLFSGRLSHFLGQISFPLYLI
jgi:peptidoglycan/LPS O-acetylase OafA/YrhL